MAPEAEHIKLVATNRKAHYQYVIEETYEAGLELVGSEVKSLRQGTCSISESFARPRGGEIYVIDMHIPPYAQAGDRNHEPKRHRKLLLQRRQIDKIVSQCTQRGYTLVPLRVYFKDGWAKIEIALARSKRPGDKREKTRAKQQRKDVDSALGQRGKASRSKR